MKLFYDFHIHSCLSPCGDEDSTPNNIVNMALIKGLNVIALADHNTGKNCPAAMAVGKKNGLVVLPGMELTTSEDIHVLCLFERYEDLQKLEEHISRTRLRVKNKPHIFGRQRILNERDEPIGKRRICSSSAAACRWRRSRRWYRGSEASPFPPTSTSRPTRFWRCWAPSIPRSAYARRMCAGWRRRPTSHRRFGRSLHLGYFGSGALDRGGDLFGARRLCGAAADGGREIASERESSAFLWILRSESE